LKGFLKGFWWPFRLSKSVKYSQSYSLNEVCDNNLLDELSKKESEMETVEELFSKMRNKFGETAKEERKVKQLRTIEQEKRMCNEYVQGFKKIARGSRYKG